MRADHIIKFHTDHPMMTPKLVGLRLTGALNSPISQENILKGVQNVRNWVGQMPKIVKAKKSVAGFKLRKGTDLLILVTIRNKVYLKSLADSIIYTLMEENMKGTELNGNIKFGLSKPFNKLGGAGVNIEFFVKGQVNNTRGQFFKSQLLIP